MNVPLRKGNVNMNGVFEMHPKVYVKQGKNEIPVFVLPDATGTSKGQLEEVCTKLDRPVCYFRDLRLDDKNIPTEISLNRLAKSYIYSIVTTLEEIKYDSLCPILIIGYSGGGVLLNVMMQQIQESKNNDDEDADDEEKRRFSEAIDKIQGRYILPIYIDSVAPHLISEMPGQDFANHLIEVLLKIKEKYSQITLNGAIVNGKPSSKWPFTDSKIQQLNWLRENLQIRVNDTQADLVQKIIENFLQDFKVMMANHACYCRYSSVSKIGYGAAIASSKTVNDFHGLSKDTYLGYSYESSVAKLILEGTHYTILSGVNAEKLSSFLNDMIFKNDNDLIFNATVHGMCQLIQKYGKLSPERRTNHVRRTCSTFFEAAPTNNFKRLRQNLMQVLESYRANECQEPGVTTLAMEML
jgi:hypothetical protein